MVDAALVHSTFPSSEEDIPFNQEVFERADRAGWMGPTGMARTEYEAGSGPGQRRVPA